MNTKVNHTAEEELKNRIMKIEKQVKIGQKCHHYKSPNTIYTIVDIGIMEETEQVAIIYKTEAGVTWIRTASNFLEEVIVDDKKVPRFTLLPR